jgi:GrpB-like predicted nucleotidyltransferase (UPF0157 family)
MIERVAAVGESDPVEIVEYDDRWPASYEVAASEIRAALAPWLVDIEHKEAPPCLAFLPSR